MLPTQAAPGQMLSCGTASARLAVSGRKTVARGAVSRSPRCPRIVTRASVGPIVAAPIFLTFTPWTAAAGGLLLGVATCAQALLAGRVLGFSGIIKGCVTGDVRRWRLSLVMGILAGGLLISHFIPGTFEAMPASYTWGRSVLGGLLVGLGVAASNGCTSGHGICGNARLSLRSFVATITFMATGAAAAVVTRTGDALGIAHRASGIFTPQPPPSAAFIQTWAMLMVASVALFATVAVFAGAPRNAQPKAAEAGAAEMLTEFSVGLVSALGLGLSGMTKASKVAGFLSVTSTFFDPTLLFVMAGALALALPVFTLIQTRLAAPFLGAPWVLPQMTAVDQRLVFGAAIFGLGWGATGMCPGPLLINMVRPSSQVALAFFSMVLGMVIVEKFSPV